MEFLWLHQPHPCRSCGKTLQLAYPTCATAACRNDWRERCRLQSIATLRAQRHRERKCRDCMKLLPKDSTAWRCEPCKKVQRDRAREKTREEAYRAYQDKLAFAHAQRVIQKQEAQRLRERIKEEERIHQEARELAQHGWKNEEGELIAEEL